MLCSSLVAAVCHLEEFWMHVVDRRVRWYDRTLFVREKLHQCSFMITYVSIYTSLTKRLEVVIRRILLMRPCFYCKMHVPIREYSDVRVMASTMPFSLWPFGEMQPTLKSAGKDIIVSSWDSDKIGQVRSRATKRIITLLLHFITLCLHSCVNCAISRPKTRVGGLNWVIIVRTSRLSR